MKQTKNISLNAEMKADAQVVAFLIMEDLKSNRLLNMLNKIGLDDQYHRSSLGTLILSALGFSEPPITLYRSYYSLLDTYNEQLETDNKNLSTAAFELYADLLIEKEKFH